MSWLMYMHANTPHITSSHLISPSFSLKIIGGGHGVGSVVIPKTSLLISKGAEHLQEFVIKDSDKGVVRRFCKLCGTHITAGNEDHPVLAISAGTLADPTLFQPQVG